MTAKILGINDETNTCEHCGKTNLKRVVIIQLDSGEIVRYGVDCAARALGKRTGKDAKSAAKRFNKIQQWVSVVEVAQVNKGVRYTDAQLVAAVYNKFAGYATISDGIIKVQGVGEFKRP